MTAAIVSIACLLGAGEVSAQTIFCPSTISGVDTGTGFGLANGRCTNGNAGSGAFSGAALGSQSLSDLGQGSTEATTNAASSQVLDRREQEQQRCGNGLVRIDGVCQRPRNRQSDRAAPAGRAKPRMVTETRMVKRGGKMVRTRVRVPAPEAVPTYEQVGGAPYLIPVDPTLRVGAFARGFGDYEERMGRSGSQLTYLGVQTVPLTILTKSRATLTGMIGGIDFTTRGLVTADDGLIFGVLSGYSENDVRLTSRILSSNLTLVNNGSSTLNAHASGGSVGAFLTYFQGPASVDFMYKADFLGLTEKFNDNEAFTASALNITPTNVAIAGGGSTSLTTHSLIANANYRIPLGYGYWMEPTAGVQARWSEYAASAANLGLANGHTIRLQAGSRFGWDFEYAGMRITPSITGLAYSDVSVRGGFLDASTNGSFGATSVPTGLSGTSVINIRQEGLLRGQGILTLVGDLGGGMTAFVQGDVRGGKDLFGAGGKAGLRYQW